MSPILGFQAFSDSNGNLWIADGWVSQLRSGVRLPTGSGDDLPPLLTAPDGSRFVAVPGTTGGTFVGGSGRNLILSGLAPGTSGPVLPVGIFTPGRPDTFGKGIFTLTKTSGTTADIHDGTNTVASQTAGSAPVGSYAATAYGKTTYNGGADFTLTAAAEEGAPGVIPSYSVSVSAGTAQVGIFTATDAANYVSADDSNWTIVVASDGTAELIHSAVVIATRPVGSAYEAGGVFEATSAGKTACNSGTEWRAFVQVIPRPVRAGFAYIDLTETSSVLTYVAGPYFATALPADGSGIFHAPLLISDGIGNLEQLHIGLLCFQLPGGDPGPTGATGGPDITTRALFILGL